MLRRRYGVTPEQYEELEAQQGGLCAMCDKPNWRPLVIDHSHETGLVRGLLCDSCNRLLGWYEAQRERVASYLGEVRPIGVARVQRLSEDAALPTRAHDGDAGYDLSYSGKEPFEILAGQVANVPCGIAMQWPAGAWAMIIGRSSTFHKLGLLVNVAVIDAGYRGELFACCRSLNPHPVYVQPGDKLAQLVPLPLMAGNVVKEVRWADQLDESERNTNGFGSSGR